MTQRRGPPPPPLRAAHGPIPVVPWSTAPPPAPPRSFETEPPAPVPPSAPTLPRHEPIDPRAFADDARADVRRAEEAREEARGIVHQMLEESLAPLHFRVHELERRIEMLERAPKAPGGRAVPAPVPTQPFEAAPSAPRMDLQPSPVPVPAPMLAHAAASQGPFYTAPGRPAGFAGPPPAPVIPQPMSPQYPVVPAPPSLPRFEGYDIDVSPFDGKRRRRKVILLFAVLFLVAVGGLLASMAASYMR